MKKSSFWLAIVLSLVVFSGTAIAGPGNGLVGKYYAYVDLVDLGDHPNTNIWSATYDDADLAFTRVDPNIHFYFGAANDPLCLGVSCPAHLYVTWSPIDQGLNDQYRDLCLDPDGIPHESHWDNECYGVIWSGYIEIAETGSYTFATVSDDGASVSIGEEIIIDGHRNWFFPVANTVDLEAGFHPIEVRYWEMTRWDGIRLEWINDEGQWEVIPENVFYLSEPCDSYAEWRNHGQYVRCVAHYTNSLMESGYITQEEADIIVSEAAVSDVGKK